MSRLQRPRGFVLVSMIMLLTCLFTLLFAVLTLSEQRSRLVHLNTERTILGAEARAGLSEAAHLLAGISDWSDAAEELPSGQVSLNQAAGAWHRLEVVSARSSEVTVRSVAWFEAAPGRPGVTRHLEATFRRRGLSFPDAALYGARWVVMESNARTDSYNSGTAGYDPKNPGTQGHVGSNADVTPITLRSNADVKGDLVVVQQAQPTVRPNSHYLETQRREEPLPLPLVAVPDDLAGSSSRGDVHSGVPVELAPGRYGDLTTGAKGHVVLQPGDYLFDRIEMGQNSVLLLSAGKVRIFVRERVEFGSNTRINMDAENQDSTSLLILADYSTGQKTGFHFDSNCDVVGALYNPLGPIHLESNTQVFGNVTGDTVQMDSFAQVHKDRALQSVVLAPDPDGGQGVRRTSWSSW